MSESREKELNNIFKQINEHIDLLNGYIDVAGEYIKRLEEDKEYLDETRKTTLEKQVEHIDKSMDRLANCIEQQGKCIRRLKEKEHMKETTNTTMVEHEKRMIECQARSWYTEIQCCEMVNTILQMICKPPMTIFRSRYILEKALSVIDDSIQRSTWESPLVCKPTSDEAYINRYLFHDAYFNEIRAELNRLLEQDQCDHENIELQSGNV